MIWTDLAAHIASTCTLDSPVQCLAQLAEHPEESLLNHLDATGVAGPLVLERLVVPALAEASVGAPMRVAAAAMVAIAGQVCNALGPALDHEHQQIRDALVMAVRLAGHEGFDDWLRGQLARQQTTLRYAGLLELADTFCSQLNRAECSRRSALAGLRRGQDKIAEVEICCIGRAGWRL